MGTWAMDGDTTHHRSFNPLNRGNAMGTMPIHTWMKESRLVSIL